MLRSLSYAAFSPKAPSATVPSTRRPVLSTCRLLCGEVLAGAPNVHLDDVVHAAVIAVGEAPPPAPEPCTVTAKYRICPGKQDYSEELVPNPAHVVFRADHPFLYVIRELPSGEVLFVGRLVDPTTP